MNQEPAIVPSTETSPIVRIFGIGSAGVGVLAQLVQDGIPGDALIAIHSNTGAFAALAGVEKIEVHKKPGNLSNAANEIGCEELLTEEVLSRIRALCSAADFVIIIAGMGGVLGGILSPSLASVAHESGAFVLAFAVMPFECEGSRRIEMASAGFNRVKNAADLLLCYPNQKTLGLINEKTSLADTFNVANRLLASGVRGTWRALCSEIALGHRFSDLYQSMVQDSKECSFAVAESVGPNRVTEAVDRLFAHPLATGPNVLPAAKTVAVYILGGPSLGLAEVNRIMEQFQTRCETSSLLMGAANIPELGDSLILSVLFSASSLEMECSISSDEEAAVPGSDRGNLGIQLLENTSGERRNSRFLPPPPSLPPEKMQQLLKQQGRTGRPRKGQARFRQTQLPLEILSKGRFDKSEPTIHKGEDLDVPTYIRRGVSLN
jgi:cell division protein FtsZ